MKLSSQYIDLNLECDAVRYVSCCAATFLTTLEKLNSKIEMISDAVQK